jgi:hypothetical protein
MPISDELASAFDKLLQRRQACIALAQQERPGEDVLFREALKSLADAEAKFSALLDNE